MCQVSALLVKVESGKKLRFKDYNVNPNFFGSLKKRFKPSFFCANS